MGNWKSCQRPVRFADRSGTRKKFQFTILQYIVYHWLCAYYFTVNYCYWTRKSHAFSRPSLNLQLIQDYGMLLFASRFQFTFNLWSLDNRVASNRIKAFASESQFTFRFTWYLTTNFVSEFQFTWNEHETSRPDFNLLSILWHIPRPSFNLPSEFSAGISIDQKRTRDLTSGF